MQDQRMRSQQCSCTPDEPFHRSSPSNACCSSGYQAPRTNGCTCTASDTGCEKSNATPAFYDHLLNGAGSSVGHLRRMRPAAYALLGTAEPAREPVQAPSVQQRAQDRSRPCQARSHTACGWRASLVRLLPSPSTVPVRLDARRVRGPRRAARPAREPDQAPLQRRGRAAQAQHGERAEREGAQRHQRYGGAVPVRGAQLRDAGARGLPARAQRLPGRVQAALQPGRQLRPGNAWGDGSEISASVACTPVQASPVSHKPAAPSAHGRASLCGHKRRAEPTPGISQVAVTP